jgi:hypothetical protein
MSCLLFPGIILGEGYRSNLDIREEVVNFICEFLCCIIHFFLFINEPPNYVSYGMIP